MNNYVTFSMFKILCTTTSTSKTFFKTKLKPRIHPSFPLSLEITNLLFVSTDVPVLNIS